MDALLVSSTPDHHHKPISPYKQQQQQQSRNSRRNNNQGFIYGPMIDNLPSYHQSLSFHGRGGDIVLAGPPLFASSSVPCRQPPLLPLPISTNLYSSLPAAAAGARNTNTNRGGSPPTNKKQHFKSCPTTSFKRDSPKAAAGKSTSQGTTSAVVTSMNRLGPEPSDLPLSGDFKSTSLTIFSLAPPPSSLPLPKFCLKPKLVSSSSSSCKAEAKATAVVDAGATDDLRK